LEAAIVGVPLTGYGHMEVGVEIEAVPEGLDYCHHLGHDVSIGMGVHVGSDGPYAQRHRWLRGARS
jgi:hypothetical protein